MQAAHPVLYQSKDLQNFLEASEDEWAMDMARANHESSGGNPGAEDAKQHAGQAEALLGSRRWLAASMLTRRRTPSTSRYWQHCSSKSAAGHHVALLHSYLNT